MPTTVKILLLALALGASAAQAGSQQFGPYEVLYTVVNTTFVEPEVAARYQLVRARDRAFVNLAIREQLPDGSDRAVSARIEGRTWDLFQNQFLEFREVREGDAVYYIADFEFSDAEIRFFDIQLLPAGAKRSSQLKFQQKVYDQK
ncbi:MAG: DUF4426 domain-containing protein [Halieaceae bacterium]